MSNRRTAREMLEDFEEVAVTLSTAERLQLQAALETANCLVIIAQHLQCIHDGMGKPPSQESMDEIARMVEVATAARKKQMSWWRRIFWA